MNAQRRHFLRIAAAGGTAAALGLLSPFSSTWANTRVGKPIRPAEGAGRVIAANGNPLLIINPETGALRELWPRQEQGYWHHTLTLSNGNVLAVPMDSPTLAEIDRPAERFRLHTPDPEIIFRGHAVEVDGKAYITAEYNPIISGTHSPTEMAAKDDDRQDTGLLVVLDVESMKIDRVIRVGASGPHDVVRLGDDIVTGNYGYGYGPEGHLGIHETDGSYKLVNPSVSFVPIGGEEPREVVSLDQGGVVGHIAVTHDDRVAAVFAETVYLAHLEEQEIDFDLMAQKDKVWRDKAKLPLQIGITDDRGEVEYTDYSPEEMRRSQSITHNPVSQVTIAANSASNSVWMLDADDRMHLVDTAKIGLHNPRATFAMGDGRVGVLGHHRHLALFEPERPDKGKLVKTEDYAHLTVHAAWDHNPA